MPGGVRVDLIQENFTTGALATKLFAKSSDRVFATSTKRGTSLTDTEYSFVSPRERSLLEKMLCALSHFQDGILPIFWATT